MRENVRDHVALQSRYSKAYTKVLDHFTTLIAKRRSQAASSRSAAAEGELSAYEEDRIQRMRSNHNFLAQLELDNPYQPLQE